MKRIVTLSKQADFWGVGYFTTSCSFLGDFLYNQRCYQPRSGLQALLEALFYSLSLDFVTKKREKQLNGVLKAAGRAR